MPLIKGAVAVAPVVSKATIASATFAQRSYSSTFSAGGNLAGRSVDDVAASIRSGSMGASDVPVNVIVREGSTLILNTKSAQALTHAGGASNRLECGQQNR